MNQTVLTLTPGGAPLAQSLGFEARTVTVDNFTWSYLTLTDVGRTLPPWAYGAVVPLPPGLRTATARLTATAGVSGPPVPSIQATLTWTDAQLPANPGHILAQAQYVRVNPTSFVTASVPANSPTVQVTDVTPFVAGDMLYLHKQNGSASASGAIISLVDPSTNTITVTTTIGVAVDPGDTVSVLPAIFNRVNVASGAQPVTMATATPAPWQAANATVSIGTAIGPGATLGLVAAAAGVTVYVHNVDLGWDAAVAGGAVELQDTTGVGIHQFSTSAVIANPYRGAGRALVTGRGLQLKSLLGGATVIPRGSAGYAT